MIPDKTIELSVQELTILSEALSCYKEKVFDRYEHVKPLEGDRSLTHFYYDQGQIFIIEALQNRIAQRLLFSDQMINHYIEIEKEKK